LKFADALKQAGLAGKLVFWGCPRRYNTDESIKREPLNEIPQEHWKDFEIDWIAAFDIKPPTDAPQHIGKENFYLGTHTLWENKENKIAYMDLHVNSAQSKCGCIKSYKEPQYFIQEKFFAKIWVRKEGIPLLQKREGGDSNTSPPPPLLAF